MLARGPVAPVVARTSAGNLVCNKRVAALKDKTGSSASGDTFAEVLDSRTLGSASETGPDRDNIRSLRVTVVVPLWSTDCSVLDKGAVVAAGSVDGRSSRGASTRDLCLDNRLPIVDSLFPRRR